jgi:hypothetical protein
MVVVLVKTAATAAPFQSLLPLGRGFVGLSSGSEGAASRICLREECGGEGDGEGAIEREREREREREELRGRGRGRNRKKVKEGEA